MNRILNTILMIAIALSTMACAKRIELAGEWRISSVAEDTIQVTEASPSLSFNANTGRIHGYTGVNIVNGEYVHEGRRLSLKGLGVTMMAGPEEDMKIERAILDAFNDVKTIKMTDEGVLQMLNSKAEVIMTLVRHDH